MNGKITIKLFISYLKKEAKTKFKLYSLSFTKNFKFGNLIRILENNTCFIKMSSKH